MPLEAVKNEWAECFAHPEQVGQVESIVAAPEPPHDMLVTLRSGEQFSVPAGRSAGATAANDQARQLAEACGK